MVIGQDESRTTDGGAAFCKDIMDETGIDKSNVSAWVNGTRTMSQPVRAMFYYYIWQKAAVVAGNAKSA